MEALTYQHEFLPYTSFILYHGFLPDRLKIFEPDIRWNVTQEIDLLQNEVDNLEHDRLEHLFNPIKIIYYHYQIMKRKGRIDELFKVFEILNTPDNDN